MIAPSFGDIFRTNAINTGLAPGSAAGSERSRSSARRSPTENELTVDLEHLRITHPGGLAWTFEFDAHAQETLVNGLDDVARTLQRADEITAYEADHVARFDARALVL